MIRAYICVPTPSKMLCTQQMIADKNKEKNDKDNKEPVLPIFLFCIHSKA